MVSFSHCSIWGKKGENICLQIWRPLRFDDIDKLITDHRQKLINVKQRFFFFFTVITTGWSTVWRPVSSRACTLSGETSSVAQTSSLCLWHVSQLTSRLLSGVYAFGFLSMAPQLFVNYKVGPVPRMNSSDTVNRRRNKCLTLLCVPPTCLDQLKSVSQLSRAVLMYRVSVNTFHICCIKRRVLAELVVRSVSLPALPFFSNCPTGGEHTYHRSVLLHLLFLPFPFRLLVSSTLLLQRWAPPLLLPLPAMVGHHTR